MDQHETEPNLSGTPYGFYQHDDGYGGLPYTPQQHMSYPVVPNPPAPDMLQMRQLNLLTHASFQYPTSPTQVASEMQLPPSPSPVESNSVYEHPMSPPISGSDTSTDGSAYHHTSHATYPYSRESSSPPSARRSHGQYRYNPTSGRRRRRSSTEGDFSEEEQLVGNSTSSSLQGQALAEHLSNNRKEATRRQRIEAEQKRRDELREGYAQLKNVLPLTNQKSSKVSLLERATNYITSVDQKSKIQAARIIALEAQVTRLREANDRLAMLVAEHTGQVPADHLIDIPYPQAAYEEEQQQIDGRPLSPPPDLQPQAVTPQAIPHVEPDLHGQQQMPPPPLPPQRHHHVHPHAHQHQHPHEHPHLLYQHRNDSGASASGSEY